jgi:hypothetical protein
MGGEVGGMGMLGGSFMGGMGEGLGMEMPNFGSMPGMGGPGGQGGPGGSGAGPGGDAGGSTGGMGGGTGGAGGGLSAPALPPQPQLPPAAPRGAIAIMPFAIIWLMWGTYRLGRQIEACMKVILLEIARNNPARERELREQWESDRELERKENRFQLIWAGVFGAVVLVIWVLLSSRS